MLLFLRQGPCSPGWSQTDYVAKNELGILKFLPPPPECRENKSVPSCLAYLMLETEFRASCRSARMLSDESQLPSLFFHQDFQIKLNYIFNMINKPSKWKENFLRQGPEFARTFTSVLPITTFGPLIFSLKNKKLLCLHQAKDLILILSSGDFDTQLHFSVNMMTLEIL